MQSYKNKYSIELLKECAIYNQTHSLKETAVKFNIPYGTLKGALVRHGLRIPTHKVKNISWNKCPDITYFDVIDSHEKAYYLGFIYADGSISSGNYPNSKVFSFGLQQSDEYILQNLLNAFEINIGLTRSKKASRINLYNKHLCEALFALGVQEQKSYKDFKIPNINEEFISSFILGYFDGDGCISLPTKYKGKQAYVGITCNSKIFLTDVQSVLQKQNINSSIRQVQKPKNILYVLEICKKSEYLKFSDYIYSNFSNSLTRKKDKFNEVKSKNNYGVTNN